MDIETIDDMLENIVGGKSNTGLFSYSFKCEADTNGSLCKKNCIYSCSTNTNGTTTGYIQGLDNGHA
ncbi:MAG: hypothetical protein NC252_12290 [Roseburia sp.]|nr:hypothetical protein [Roseburia sp.]